MNLLDDLLKDLVIDVSEEFVKLEKADPIIILLEEPDHIGLCPSLNKVLIETTLRIVDFHECLRLYLSHQVHFLELPHVYLIFPMLVLMHNAKEIIAIGLVIKYWTIIHVILQDSKPLIYFSVDLTQQRYLFTLFLENLDSIGTHVPQTMIIWFLSEGRMRKNLIRIDVPLKLACHSEIVDKQGSLVNMLEEAESAIF